MRKTLLAILLSLTLAVFPAAGVLAATSEDVTVYATPTFISITNSPDSFDFGLVVADIDEDTGTSYFSVTNDSTANITVTIQCTSPWEGGANDWTYGTPAANAGQLKASAGTGLYDVTVPTATAPTLFTSTSAGQDFTWELQLDAPTSFTYGNPQQCTVTIAASAS